MASILNILGLINSVFAIENSVKNLVKSLKSGRDRLKTFKFDVNWKNRVINVPIAIDQMRKFVNDSLGDVLDAAQEIADKIDLARTQIDLAKSGAGAFAGKPVPESVFLGLQFELLLQLVQEIPPIIDKVSDFTKVFDNIISEIEKLDDLFLQQGNKRKKVLAIPEGHSVNIRVGKLHSSV